MIRATVAATPDSAARLAGQAIAPPIGEWSAREVLRHLAVVDEAVWQPRLDSLRDAGGARGDADVPQWSWVEPGLWSGPGDDTLEGVLAAFRDRRAGTLARIDALGETGWRRFGIHATYGRLDVAGLLRILADHDAEHLRQLAAFSG